MTKEIKEVAGYVRVSTSEQAQKGLSIESQIEDIREYCQRNKYHLVDIYIDKGITARKELYKRESFMRMMNDVKSKKVNHIVVLRLDRFFRNVYDYHRMMNDYLLPNNCGWSAIKEDYDTTTTNGRLMINLRLSIAEQECDQDSDRIKDVFANRIRQGYVVTGRCPYGYKIEDKKWIPDENAQFIKDMFDTYLRTSSIRKTMQELNAQYNTKYEYYWIARSLRKEFYIGKYRDNTNYCEPLVDIETFNQVQKTLSRNIRVRKYKNCYVFMGLIRCSCGRIETGNNTHPWIYYRCGNHFQNFKCGNNQYLPQKYVEEYLLTNIHKLFKEYEMSFEVAEKPQKVKSNKASIDKKIDRLTELYVNELIDIDTYKSRRKELESQIIEPEVTEKKDLSHIREVLNSGFQNIYDDFSDEEKRFFWRSIIKEIRIDGKKIKEVIFL